MKRSYVPSAFSVRLILWMNMIDSVIYDTQVK